MDKPTNWNDKGVFATLTRENIRVEGKGSNIMASDFVMKPDLQIVQSNQGREGECNGIEALEFFVEPDLHAVKVTGGGEGGDSNIVPKAIPGNSDSGVLLNKGGGECGGSDIEAFNFVTEPDLHVAKATGGGEGGGSFTSIASSLPKEFMLLHQNESHHDDYCNERKRKSYMVGIPTTIEVETRLSNHLSCRLLMSNERQADLWQVKDPGFIPGWATGSRVTGQNLH
eukprot:15364659-Ditylum_brightwellii.AAC.1